ncbi:hypothetical protein F4802DRAFT_246963 [Xylaria palmicola]|nr:hypothetical protein F4802DRAFT_246963 [Xylaria palmicola]
MRAGSFSRTKPPYILSSGSSTTTTTNPSSPHSVSSGGGSRFPRRKVDETSPFKTNSHVPEAKKDRRAVCGPPPFLPTDTSELCEVDSDVPFWDLDGESFVYGSTGSGSSLDEITPEDSISVRGLHRESHEAVSDSEKREDEVVNIRTSRKAKFEDRLTRLGYVERLPDIDGQRHYRIELGIDKLLEEDKVRTRLGTISLSSSKLAIFNSDGLQPKLASDLYNFNNGFIEVKKSPLSGYGIFATQDLDPYTCILIERELFSAGPYDFYQRLEALTEEQMKAYKSLHCHMRSPSEDIRAAIWRTNRYVRAHSEIQIVRAAPVMLILSSCLMYRFAVSPGGAVFLVASRFNHACNDRNNTDYSYDGAKKCMVFRTKKKAAAGSELFIQYGTDPTHLLLNWGFRCRCGGCAGVPEDARDTTGMSWPEDSNWVSW